MTIETELWEDVDSFPFSMKDYHSSAQYKPYFSMKQGIRILIAASGQFHRSIMYSLWGKTQKVADGKFYGI